MALPILALLALLPATVYSQAIKSDPALNDLASDKLWAGLNPFSADQSKFVFKETTPPPSGPKGMYVASSKELPSLANIPNTAVDPPVPERAVSSSGAKAATIDDVMKTLATGYTAVELGGDGHTAKAVSVQLNMKDPQVATNLKKFAIMAATRNDSVVPGEKEREVNSLKGSKNVESILVVEPVVKKRIGVMRVASIIGADDRKMVEWIKRATLQPNHQVGMLVIGFRGAFYRCTGTLVGPKHVITAGGVVGLVENKKWL